MRLIPEIDPLSLKSSELKAILKKNDVSFPSDASKKQLVSIFWESSSKESNPKIGEGDLKAENIEKKNSKKDKRRRSKIQKPSEIEVDDANSKKPEKLKEIANNSTQSVGISPNVSTTEQSVEEGKDREDPTTPVKSGNGKNIIKKDTGDDQSASKNLRKRRSMLLKVDIPHSDSPSKGNVFEVDLDSDKEILSPRKKKPKTAAKSASRKTRSKSPKVVAKPSTPLKEADTTSQVTPSKKGNDENLTAQISEMNEENNSGGEKSVIESKSFNSIHDSLTFNETPNKEPAETSKKPQTAKSPITEESSSDTAPSFDKALRKLKKADTLGTEKQKSPNLQTDEELAKYLGVDIRSVKPKHANTRVITPRRPIVILKSELNRLRDSLNGSVESKNNSTAIADGNTINILASLSADESTSANSSELSVLDSNVEPRKLNFFFMKNFLYLLLWLSVVGGLLYGYWFREQTILIGYCGQEINQRTIPKSQNYPYLLSQAGEYLDDNFKPDCIDCPQHARCFPKLEIACYDDFVPFAPWYYKYLPFIDPKAQKCVSDTKKAEKIEIMIDISLDLLRARNANKQCGRSSPDDLDAGLSLTDLHNLLLSLKAPYITEEEFEELWTRAAVELEKEPEIIVRQVDFFKERFTKEYYTNKQTGFRNSDPYTRGESQNEIREKDFQNKVLRSTSLSHLSFKCLMSNTLVSILIKFKLAVFILACIIIVIAGVYWKYQQSQIYAQKIETIYKEVLNKLQRQARMAQESTELPAYIGSIQLRDLILSSENNLAYKMRLWEGISRKVDRNTNVSHELLEVHGDVMKVWQWIGSFE